MRIQPLSQEGFDKWLADEWSRYANTISANKGVCLYLDVKVGEPLYRVGKSTPNEQIVLYEGTCSAEALRVWNDHRREA